MKVSILVLSVLVNTFTALAQKENYSIKTIAFYNVENLFDTINDPKTFDDNRTPEGNDRWTSERYLKKIDRLAYVISEIGHEITQTPPDIVGVAEVENLGVLKNLVDHPLLKPYKYNIIHINSPDGRGIDVAMLFKEGIFTPVDYKNYILHLTDEFNQRIYTRDQLLVTGLMDGQLFHFIINHWPSRRGGETKSNFKRIKAAMLNKRIIDSIQKTEPLSKIISMGDFNDDPFNDSFKKILKTKDQYTYSENTDLINPMETLYKKGYGSLAYGDSWNLFDQFFFTASLLTDSESYRFWQARIFNPLYLTTPEGRYKGYPLRTYAGGTYLGGYSDHFPVYIYLIKKHP